MLEMGVGWECSGVFLGEWGGGGGGRSSLADVQISQDVGSVEPFDYVAPVKI